MAKMSLKMARKSRMVDFYITNSQTRVATRDTGTEWTHIPESGPSYKIWMINLSLGVYMLAGSDHHGFGGSHVDQRSLSRVGVRNPY